MILKERVPVDDAWHALAVGSIVHVDHQDVDYVTLWFDDRIPNDAPEPRYYRVFATGEPVPSDAVYVGSSLDPRGLVWHLFYTSEKGMDSPVTHPGRRK